MVVSTARAAAVRREVESAAAAAAGAAAVAVSAHPGGGSRTCGKRNEGRGEGGRADGAAIAVRRFSILILVKVRIGKGVYTVNISGQETLRRGRKPGTALICAADCLYK